MSKPLTSEQLVEGMVTTAFDWLPPESRGLLIALLRSSGRRISPAEIAQQLGFSNRHRLARRLERHGLPSIEVLATWMRILVWLVTWEIDRVSLTRAALRVGHDPAIRFRAVRDAFGCTWRELQVRGSAWVVLEMRRRCTPMQEADQERLA